MIIKIELNFKKLESSSKFLESNYNLLNKKIDNKKKATEYVAFKYLYLIFFLRYFS